MKKVYKTTNRHYSDLEFKYDKTQVSISRNGVVWGSPQGEGFVITLLEDIEKLKEENQRLKHRVELLGGNTDC